MAPWGARVGAAFTAWSEAWPGGAEAGPLLGRRSCLKPPLLATPGGRARRSAAAPRLPGTCDGLGEQPGLGRPRPVPCSPGEFVPHHCSKQQCLGSEGSAQLLQLGPASGHDSQGSPAPGRPASRLVSVAGPVRSPPTPNTRICAQPWTQVWKASAPWC